MYQNPTTIPTADHERLWQHLVDVMDDYFQIEREEPVRRLGQTLIQGHLKTRWLVGSTLLEPWHHDSVTRYDKWESTFHSIRRRAECRVIPTEGGFLVEVQVDKEIENLSKPEHATAGETTFRNDSSLERSSRDVSGPGRATRWIPQGRDIALEQRLIGELHARLSQQGFSLGSRFGVPHPAMSMDAEPVPAGPADAEPIPPGPTQREPVPAEPIPARP